MLSFSIYHGMQYPEPALAGMYHRGDYSVGAHTPFPRPRSHTNNTSSTSSGDGDGEGAWQRWAPLRGLSPADVAWAAAYGFHVSPSPGTGRASTDPPEDLFFPPAIGACGTLCPAPPRPAPPRPAPPRPYDM